MPNAIKSAPIAMTAPLQSAIGHAYHVFAPYEHRFTASVCTCPCCFSETDRDRILKLRLHEIDGGLLEQYSWSAHGQDDDGPLSDDLRYLLPRYFELFARNDLNLHDAPECILMQLGRTAYRSAWPTGEVSAIDGYFDALLLACLANDAIEGCSPHHNPSAYRCALRLDDVLGMMICAGADVKQLLAIWASAADPTAALHLANQRFHIAYDGAQAAMTNPHVVGDFKEAARAVGTFVTSPRSTKRIEAAFFHATEPQTQQLLSDALTQQFASKRR